ncbi:hypothetical protein [Rubricoccus marinus]|uniref:hypothetical protein n=1 Tax=Rubricoccus marinus TaxID=716817 RepID=UPI00117A8B8F|nr:hypothetical protein [Rubricoccus marinus]
MRRSTSPTACFSQAAALGWVLVFQACSAVPPADPSRIPEGEYATTFGSMRLSAASPSGRVTGGYQLDGGRIEGTYANGVLRGEWVEVRAEGTCTPRQFGYTLGGSTYYGTFTFVFNAESSRFEGTWAACGGPENETWTGKRVGNLVDRSYRLRD